MFKIIFDNDDNEYKIIHLFNIPNEFHINMLYGAITQLYTCNAFAHWSGEIEKFDDINEIRFYSDLKENQNFDVFINQIIMNIENFIENDF